MDNHLKRSIGLGSALSIIVGTIIGSGIFFKQASVLDSAGSTFMALLAWILAGIITLTAGLTIAEIGAQMPYTGGLYVYIEKIYGRVLSFMAGWMQAIVYGPAMIAAVTGFLSIMVTNLFGIGTEWRIPIGLITIIAIGGLNFLENKVGAAFTIITTIAKMIPIFAIIFCGICWDEQNAVAQTVTELNRSTGGLGVAVLAALFAYDGWIFIANLGGEIKNPQKLLPKAIIIGITTVLVIYALITIGIFSFIPADKIHALGKNSTTYLADAILGPIGGKVLSVGIIISMLGTLNGEMLTFPRIIYAMAKRGDLPFSRFLSYVTPKGKAPVIATMLLITLTGIMMTFFDPDYLSNLCVFTIYSFYVLAFFGLFILRYKNKDQRPFSVPFYPLIPLVAIAGGLFVLVSQFFNDPAGVLLFTGITAVGWPIFFLVKKMSKAQNTIIED